MDGGSGGGDDSGAVSGPRLPDDCPVKPIGVEGGVFHFLSTLGELRSLKADQVANKHIVGLFAPRSQYLLDTWPRKKLVKTKLDDGTELEEWIVTGWRTDDVSMVLMDEAARCGVWNAREKVRGRGGWRAKDGSLILHAGDKVLIGGQWQAPGVYDKMVYPSQPASPRPAKRNPDHIEDLAPKLLKYLLDRGASFDGCPTAGKVLLELFRCWQFARPGIDEYLLLGWNAASVYGGALDYRPLVWLTGDAATGKSALQKAIGRLHGAGILQSPDATEAGVRQTLGQQSLPVAIDEAEAEADNRKMQALVKLARLSATSQGNITRGGVDHQASEFRATSCFLFSSILIPPIPPQDRSRLAVLEMEPIKAGMREPPLDERELEQLGAQLRKDMADRWPLWPARLQMYWNAMIDIGKHKGRTADQFGGLLAAADLLLSRDPPDKTRVDAWARDLAADRLTETAENTSEAERCIQWLVTSPVQLTRGGERRTIGEWLGDAVASMDKGLTDAAAIRAGARDALGRIGIALPETKKGVPGVVYVAIASSHRGLSEVFAGSTWGDGVWSQALRRTPGALKNERAKINGSSMACTLLPITEMLRDDAAAAVAEREIVE
ncbi:MAG: hypothetical protein ACK4IS_13285 [Erythrobacter sp.]